MPAKCWQAADTGATVSASCLQLSISCSVSNCICTTQTEHHDPLAASLIDSPFSVWWLISWLLSQGPAWKVHLFVGECIPARHTTEQGEKKAVRRPKQANIVKSCSIYSFVQDIVLKLVHKHSAPVELEQTTYHALAEARIAYEKAQIVQHQLKQAVADLKKVIPNDTDQHGM